MLKIALRGRKSTARGERVTRRVKAIFSIISHLLPLSAVERDSGEWESNKPISMEVEQSFNK